VNNELPSSSPKEPRSLDEAFAQKPHLRQRLLEISDRVDAAVAEEVSAHEAEARTIEQIRGLGHALWTEWGEKTEQQARTQARQGNPTLQPYRKKKPDVALDLRPD
jgi:hypothetical protein